MAIGWARYFLHSKLLNDKKTFAKPPFPRQRPKKVELILNTNVCNILRQYLKLTSAPENCLFL